MIELDSRVMITEGFFNEIEALLSLEVGVEERERLVCLVGKLVGLFDELSNKSDKSSEQGNDP